MNNNGKMKTFLAEFSGYAANVVIIVGYVMMQSSGLIETGKSFFEVMVDGFLLLLLTNILRMSLFSTGIQRGYAGELWRSTANAHEDKLKIIMPYINKFSDFLEFDYRKRLKLERIIYLRGIDYSLIFDESGKIKNYVHPIPNVDDLNKKEAKYRLKKYKFECKNIEKAKSVIVPLYMPNEIISRSKSQKRMFRTSTVRTTLTVFITGALLSIFIAAFSGMFEPTGINWTSFWYSVGLALIALALGLTSFLTGYMHIAQDMRGDVIDKTHYLGQFEEWIKNGGNNE